MIKWAVYDPRKDGNVFNWILEASNVRRQLKKWEHQNAIEKATTKSEVMDRPKMED